MTFKTVLTRPIAIAFAGAAIVLAVAGCGGASKSTTTTTTPAASTAASTTTAAAPPSISKAEYVAKANAICNATNGPLTATALKLASHPSAAEAQRIVAGEFIPEIEAQTKQIQALGIPAGGATTVATMNRLLAGDVAKIARDPSLAGPAAFHDFAKVAHAYGLTACAPLS